MTFSEKLTILRKQKGMSQEHLAELLDVSRQSVSKWEAQQALPETAKIISIANIFGVSIDLLLKDDQIIVSPEPIVAVQEKTTGELPFVMYCSACGKANSTDSAFCAYCGNSFASPSTTPTPQYTPENKTTTSTLLIVPS